jgi:hypothetical protein
VAENLKITLTDGSEIEIDADECSVVAGPVWRSAEGNLEQRLTVRCHVDGRTLITAVVETDDLITGTAGELLSPGANAMDALLRIGSQLGLVQWLIESCVKQSEDGTRSTMHTVSTFATSSRF